MTFHHFCRLVSLIWGKTLHPSDNPMTQVAPEFGLEIFERGGSKTENPDRFLRLT